LQLERYTANKKVEPVRAVVDVTAVILSKKNNEVDVRKCASCVVYFGAAVVLDVPWRVPRLALVAAKVTLAAAEVCFGEMVKY